MSRQIIYPQFSTSHPQNASLAPKEILNEGKIAITIKDLPKTTQDSLLSMSWEEIFAMAADAESFRKLLPAGDIAFGKFSHDEFFFLKLAEYMERREQYWPILSVMAEKAGV